MPDKYRYHTSLKSNISDERINTYLLRPLAGIIVWILYRTPVRPNHVTIAAIAVGVCATAFFFKGTSESVMIGGLLVTLKDILDSADGQLARAKSLYSRAGRFLDSIGDVLVNALIFTSIGWMLFERTGDLKFPLLALAGFAGLTLRVSYHVFYQTSFLHLEGMYEKNRITEEITDEDLESGAAAVGLQRVFLALYGWQDRLMISIDQWCKRGNNEKDFLQQWYGDMKGLRLSGLLGFGTELFLLMIFSVVDGLDMYLLLNLMIMNGIMLASIAYRRWVLFRGITSSDDSSGVAGTA